MSQTLSQNLPQSKSVLCRPCKDVFKPLALPCCFSTYIKQEDAQLVQIQEAAGLHGGAITSTMMALTSAWQTIQQTAIYHIQELATETVVTIEELKGPALTQLGHVLGPAACSFNNLSDKRWKGAFNKFWHYTNELVGMLNKDYPCLGMLLKGNVGSLLFVKSTLSN